LANVIPVGTLFKIVLLLNLHLKAKTESVQ